jgi:hypothetical protein
MSLCVRATHEAAVDELQSSQAKALTELKQAHEKDTARLQDEHKAALATKQQTLDQELEELKTKHDALKVGLELESLVNNAQSTYRRK